MLEQKKALATFFGKFITCIRGKVTQKAHIELILSQNVFDN